MTHPHEEEMLECFDADGKPVGIFPRSEVHATMPPKWWHKIVSVWLVDKDGRILCSKRSAQVGSGSGKWQTYFGGHLQAGQTYLQAAVSETEEEIGLTIDPAKLRLVEKVAWEPTRHFSERYMYPYEGEDLKFSDGEIAETKWFSMDEYVAAAAAEPQVWTSPCGPEARKKILELLKA